MKRALFAIACLLMATPAFAEGIEAETSLPFKIGGKEAMTLNAKGLDVVGAVKLSSDESGCNSENEGSIRYDKSRKVFEGCDGTEWGPLFKTTALNYVTNTETLCQRNGDYEVISECPAGSELLNCAGGPGDQMEAYEYWILMPDYQNNRCIGYAGQPACFDSGWSQIAVMAVCYDGYK